MASKTTTPTTAQQLIDARAKLDNLQAQAADIGPQISRNASDVNAVTDLLTRQAAIMRVADYQRGEIAKLEKQADEEAKEAQRLHMERLAAGVAAVDHELYAKLRECWQLTEERDQAGEGNAPWASATSTLRSALKKAMIVYGADFETVGLGSSVRLIGI